MQRSRIPILGSVAALLLLQASARADLVSWSYNWTPNANTINADNAGTSKIFITNEPSGTARGATDLAATNIKVSSTASPNHPDTFTHAAYTLTMTLIDSASKQSANLSFSGFFSGTVSSLSSNISNTFTGPTTNQVVLGGNLYTVTIGPYAPPAPPGATLSGSISAHAEVTAAHVDHAPEPAGMVLAGLGVSVFGFGYWCQRRRK
jgi:hypothetical protein